MLDFMTMEGASRLQEPLVEFEVGDKLDVPKVDQKKKNYIQIGKMPLVLTSSIRNSRMQEEKKQVATPKVTLQVSILRKKFPMHVALTYSIIDIEVSSSEKAAEEQV